MRRLEPLCCAFAGYTGFSWFVKPTHWCGRFTWAQLVSVVKPVIAEWVRWAGLRVEWLRTNQQPAWRPKLAPHGGLRRCAANPAAGGGSPCRGAYPAAIDSAQEDAAPSEDNHKRTLEERFQLHCGGVECGEEQWGRRRCNGRSG
jgi:hypothetical protein